MVTVGGQVSNGVTFTLSNAGTVAGVITRASDGSAVSGVTVEALQSGSIKGSATSAADGSYSLTNLAAGTYDVSAFPPSGYFNVTKSGTLVAATKTATVNFSLGAPQISSVSPSSGPIGSTVTLSGSGFGSSQGVSTITFNRTPATPTSWSDTTVSTPVPAGATTGPVVVTAAGVASNSVTFTPGIGSASGTVTQTQGGTSVSGALVALLQANSVKASATTQSDGTYSLSSLNPGTYDFRFSSNGLGTVITAGQLVSAGSGTTVNASLPGTGTISGQVTKADGITAIQGATVTVLQGATSAATATSDASGNYSMASLSAGSYSAQASAAGYTTQSQNGLSVSTGNTTTANFSMPGQSVISYAYDSLGRLVGVSDSRTSAAIYAYDAVGNLLSISTNPSSQVSIMGFVPTSGPVGTTVTISGTAFSTTPSQNAVQINGTSATVASASATQLVVTVPSGATTGTISITSPAGTATSTSAFTVGANTAPTVTGFNPTIGTAGTAVTITGTNFDPTPSNNSLKFNVAYAPPTSATSTTIGTNVPSLSVSSGHLSVGTSSGQTTTSNYFFIPPAPYQVSNVAFTGQVSIPSTTTVPVNSTSQIGLLVFDGVQGQRVSMVVSGNYSGGCGGVAQYFNVSILNPNGSALYPSGGFCGGAFTNTLTLGATGTYTVLVGSAGPIGSVTVTLNAVPSDFTGTIVPGGPSVIVPLSTSGQNASLSFSGTQNQRVSLGMSASYTGGCGGIAGVFTVSVIKPDGGTLTSAAGCGVYIDAITLPITGVYRILTVPPSSGLTSNLTFTLYNVIDFQGTITAGGPSVPVPLMIPGQNGRLTFTGTQGQRVSLWGSVNTPFCGGISGSFGLSLLNPDGSTLIPVYSSCFLFFFDATTLGANGTYTIFADPGNSLTGTFTLNLYNVVDATGSVTVNGSTLPVMTNTIGQNASITFTGTSGQLATVRLSGNSMGCVTVSLLPIGGGSALTSTNQCGSSFNLTQQTLPTSGTYTIYIDPNGANTGSITVGVTSP